MEAVVREWSPGSLLNSPFSNNEVEGKNGWDVHEWKAITDQIQVLPPSLSSPSLVIVSQHCTLQLAHCAAPSRPHSTGSLSHTTAQLPPHDQRLAPGLSTALCE